jgi:sugar phosphate permease
MSQSQTRIAAGWWVVAGSFLVYFMSGGLFYTATVFLKALTADFGWSRGEVSGAFAVGFLLTGFAAPFWGRLADRRGPRAALLPGAILTGLFAIALSQIASLFALYALYALLTIAAAGISLIPVSVMISNWFVEKRGRAMGIANTGEGLGALLLTPLAALLIARFGWRSAYVVLGAGLLVVLIPVVLSLRGRPQDVGLLPDGLAAGEGDPPAMPALEGESAAAVAPAASPIADPDLTLAAALRSSTFWITCIAWFIVLMPVAAVTLHQVPLMTDLGLSIERASLIAALAAGMSIVGRAGFGLLSERYPIRVVFALCYVALGAGVALLWAATQLGPATLWLYVVVFGVAIGGAFALAPLFVAAIFGVRALGEIFGVLAIAATLGGAIGPWLAGVLFDRTGSYEVVLPLAVGATLVAAVMIGLVPAPQRRAA